MPKPPTFEISNIIPLDRSGTYIEDRMPDSEARNRFRKSNHPEVSGAEKNRLREHRIKAGLGLTALWRMTGQHPTSISRHERNTGVINLHSLEMYSRAYGVDIMRFLVWDDNV